MPQTVTITISAETSSDLADVLQRLASALQTVQTQDEDAREAIETATSPVAWYRANASRFLAAVKPDARKAVLFIARHAPEVSISEVARELGKEQGPELAGTLGSVGWAVRTLGGPDKPYRRMRDAYVIEPSIAAALIDAAS